MKKSEEHPSRLILSDGQIPLLRRRICHWFGKNGRDLPWRHTCDPYAVLVSEMMLQQTTTETVLGYFNRFMSRFPTVADLAEADISEVLYYWQGLGYYRRAHLLHRTAEIVAKDYGGVFPVNRSELEKLPGLGRYTVGAVMSFAFDQREPILEANTSRLHARILGVKAELTARNVSAVLWDFARRILPAKEPGKFNQALIDLGHTVCLPHQPRCAACPCAGACIAARDKLQEVIPVPKRKPNTEYRIEVAWLVPRSFFTGKKTDRTRFLFVRYPKHLRWGGLWDFPRFLMEGDAGPRADEELARKLNVLLGSDCVFPGKPITEMTHTVTRYRIRLILCAAEGKENFGLPAFERRETDPQVEFAGGAASFSELEIRWLTLREAEEIPLNSTGRKLVALLNR